MFKNTFNLSDSAFIAYMIVWHLELTKWRVQKQQQCLRRDFWKKNKYSLKFGKLVRCQEKKMLDQIAHRCSWTVYQLYSYDYRLMMQICLKNVEILKLCNANLLRTCSWWSYLTVLVTFYLKSISINAPILNRT